MGTNYYLRTDICPHCKRAKESIHIGKSSAGWPFLFRGYREFPPDGVPVPITSALEWRQVIEIAVANGGELYNEYGEKQDVSEFWGFVDSKRTDTRGLDAYRPAFSNSEREWQDAEGYRFCSSEFS